MNEIIKSLNDNNNYEYFKLDNEIELMLIQNKNITNSYVSLNISVGSFDEEFEYNNKRIRVEGIAHFLEHMLFLGNEKYPDEDLYHNYISNHGGSTNAYTAGDHTCYFFDINNNYLYDALDIFSQFFISPLLTKDAINREINSVNSEHKKNILSDNWIQYEILKRNLNKNNPFNNFTTGTTETLLIDNIYEKLITFYNMYYSSNLMKLVIMSDKDPKELYQYVKKYFGLIKNKNIKINRIYENPINNNKDILIKVIPYSNNNLIKLSISLENYENMHLTKELNIIKYIINNENGNTLINILKKLNLIESFDIDIDNAGNYSIITFIFDVVDYNESYINDILSYFKQYLLLIINNINNNNFNKIIEELLFTSKKIFDKFEILDKTNFINDILLDWNILNIPYNKLLCNDYIYDNFSLEKIKNILYSIINNKKILLISSKNIDSNQLNLYEKYYNIKYSSNTINDPLNNSSKKVSFQFPKLNRYIVYDSPIINNLNDIKPIKIYDDKFILYKKFNNKYNNNNVQIMIYFIIPKINDNIKNHILFSLIYKIIYDLNSSFLDEISNADYNFDIGYDKDIFYLFINGNEKYMDQIISNFIKIIKYTKFDNNNFKKSLYDLNKAIKNKKTLLPYIKINYFIKRALEHDYYFYNDILSELNNIYFDDILSYYNNFLNNISLLVYIEGVFNNHLIDSIINNFDKSFIFDKNIFNRNLNIINNKTDSICDINNENNKEVNNVVSHCINLGYIQIGITKNWDIILNIINILDMIINKDFFNILRTKKQLGYVVKSFIKKIGNIQKPYYIYCFLVQSEHTNCKLISDHINNFIITYKNKIDSLNDNDIDKYKKIILKNILKNKETLYEESFSNVRSIFYSGKFFDIDKILINGLKYIDSKLIKTFYYKYFLNNKNNKSILISK